MKDRYDLLVFDWDGTLFDSIGWIVSSLQRAAAECGLAVPSEEAARAIIGLSLRHAMATLYPEHSPEDTERLAQSYRRHYNALAITPAGLFEGVTAMLPELRRRGFALAVATGKIRAGLTAALNGTGLGPLFDATRCADETASKPDPAMLVELMTELRISPDRTLMIGDSVHDLRMAQSAGVDAVAVGCGATPLAELQRLGPRAAIAETADLLRLLSD